MNEDKKNEAPRRSLSETLVNKKLRLEATDKMSRTELRPLPPSDERRNVIQLVRNGKTYGNTNNARLTFDDLDSTMLS